MIRIVTDTGANLPQSIIDEFQIEIASGHIVFDDEAILEYPHLSTAEFYRRLQHSGRPPVTRDSGVSYFRGFYSHIVSRSPGATILSIHVAESLATTITAARQAAAMIPTARILLFDTQMVSFGEGLMVWEAARMAHRDATVEAILARLRDMCGRVEMFVMVDTLTYLARGGRVGPVARFAGGLFDVKPILTVKDGEVRSFAQYRTRARALIELEQIAAARLIGKTGVRMGVMHALCEDDANQLAEHLRGHLSLEALTITEIGPAVGAHTGPGAIGLAWYAP